MRGESDVRGSWSTEHYSPFNFHINLETALKDKIYPIKLGRRQGIVREDKVCISDKGDSGKQSLMARWNWSGKKRRAAQPWEAVAVLPGGSF